MGNRRLWFRLWSMVLLGAIAFFAQSSVEKPSDTFVVHAQDGGGDSTCDMFVQDALAEVANTCLNIGRNEVCFGHSQVSATLVDDSYFFEAPGDIVPVSAVDAIFTRSADPDTGEWGIAVMDVEADLPTGSDSVRMVMFGGVDVTPNTSQLVSDQTTCDFANDTSQNFNLRAGPGTNYRVIDILDQGASLSVFGESNGGEWLRSNRGWVSSSIGNLDCESSDLRTIADVEDAYTAPMQAFTLQVNDDATCETTPPGMLIQVSEGQTANIMVNNVELRVGSTAFVTVVENDDDEGEDNSNSLLVANINGNVFATSNGSTQNVYTGSQSLIPLNQNGQANGSPSQFQPFSGVVGNLPLGLLTNTLPNGVPLPDPLVLFSSNPDDSNTTGTNGDEVPLGQWGACGTCNECKGADGDCRIDPMGACVWDPTGCGAVMSSTAGLSCSSLCGSSTGYCVGIGDSFTISYSSNDGAIISGVSSNTGGLFYISSSETYLSDTQYQINFNCTTMGGPGQFTVDVYDSEGRFFQQGFTVSCS